MFILEGRPLPRFSTFKIFKIIYHPFKKKFFLEKLQSKSCSSIFEQSSPDTTSESFQPRRNGHSLVRGNKDRWSDSLRAQDWNNGPKSRAMSAHEAARDALTVPCPSTARCSLETIFVPTRMDSFARINGRRGGCFARRELVDRKFGGADSTWRLNTNFLEPTSSFCPRRIDFATR